jgi:4-amino-4-deoxy-L-arabinose transferase-like glycosyltransferase
MKKLYWILFLVLILFGAFYVRMYKFSGLVADWHSWRQVDTSAVSRYFVEHGFDILRPKYEDLSKAVSLKDNPQGYRFVEFPIYNVLQAGFFKLFGHYTLEEWGRLVTIFSTLATIVFLYLLLAKYVGKRAGLIAAFFFAFVPYSIYYGRTILPDQSMVAALLAGTYFFSNWIEQPKFSILSWQFLLAVIFICASILLKPYALFFTLPLLYLAIRQFGFGFLKKWQFWLFLILTVTPFGLWRLWMNQPAFLPGIAQNDWLFNGNHIRFKGAFFQWLFADRISRLILGYWGLPFVVLGMLRKINKKEGWFFFLFIVYSII